MGVMGVMEEQNWRNPAPVEILKSHVKHLCIYIPQYIHIYICIPIYQQDPTSARLGKLHFCFVSFFLFFLRV